MARHQPTKLELDALELVRRTTEARGLPLTVEDPAVLRRVAGVIAGHTRKERPEGRPDRIDYPMLLLKESRRD